MQQQWWKESVVYQIWPRSFADADRWQDAELLLANYPVDAPENLQELALRPFEARLYRLR